LFYADRLVDIVGTQFVGAINGRLLTAESTTGFVGPVVVNCIRSSRSRRALSWRCYARTPGSPRQQLPVAIGPPISR
jgi:hypothetical protein